MDACQRPACKASHHYLLHMEKPQARARQGERPPTEASGAAPGPTPTEEQGSAVHLVAQWVNTKVGVPYLVFWDTGSQVTLTTHKAAQAMKLQAIPSSHVGVCITRTFEHEPVESVSRPEPQQEDMAICAVSPSSHQRVAPPHCMSKEAFSNHRISLNTPRSTVL